MVQKKNSMSQWEKLLELPDWKIKQCARWLNKHQYYALEHLAVKEEFILKVFKSTVVQLFLLKRSQLFRKKIIFMPEFQVKNKWKTFLDKLNTLENPNILGTQLLQMLLQDLILKEKACQPFWTPAYKELSEKLLLPTVTDSVALGLNSLNNWLQNPVEKLPYLTIQSSKLVNKNYLKTSYPFSMCSHVNKWEKGVMQAEKLKTLIIQIYPTTIQKNKLDEFIDTSRFVYNKAVALSKKIKVNFITMRDQLVTLDTKKNIEEYKEFDKILEVLYAEKKEKFINLKNTTIENEKETKKIKLEIELLNNKIKIKNQERRDLMKKYASEKNESILPFELNTPKDIRSNAVKKCVDAYTTGFSNLKNGNIKYFNLKFKKKTEKIQSIELSKKNIHIQDGKIKILPTIFKEECYLKVSKKNQKQIKDLIINSNIDLVRNVYGYYLHIPVSDKNTNIENTANNIAGIDLGIRTFATVHTNNLSNSETSITEYKHTDLINKLNLKKNIIKTFKRIRKKQIDKIDKKKNNITDRIHWGFINDVLSKNDIVYIGDIKSHNIVKDSNNKRLNQDFNDLKFYQLKMRLIYKAKICNKQVYYINESYTTKTCSACGIIDDTIGSKKIYECKHCKTNVGRDHTGAKNIKMKGLMCNA